MKINVTCIYWFLLLISCVSSCLLFILVASESVKTSANSEIASDANENAEINRYEGGENGAVTPDINAINTGAEVTAQADLRTSFEEVPAPTENTEPNKEFVISQNSGLSNGLSDTGQAVVYTLVDTASAELKQRADTIPTTHITQSFNEAPNVSTSSSLNFTPTILVQPPSTVTEKNDVGSTENTANTPEIPPKTEDLKTSNSSSQEETKTNTQTNKEDYIVRAEPKIITKEEIPTVQQNRTTEPDVQIPTIEVANKSEDKEPVKEENEDIPSFSEWTQKQLEEAEKKKEKVNTSAQNQQSSKPSSNLKLRSKNYASPDCGAKIVAANPEAMYAGSVLSPSRDEYKLNTCTSRIWFIVELCEAIQAKKIDLANFELFSSSPKDFTVSVSDRFPSRDWSSVGHFQAKDERDIQSFNLHPHLFGKFIKVEMLSHWGSEHFCPISLFRVYGTSEFEVLETEDQVEASPDENDDDDDDDEETLDSYKGEHTNNLFGSARDAVMSIVKKAAEVLVKSGDKANQTLKNDERINRYSPLINTCSAPSHLVVCDNCSDILFGKVYELLSCHRQFLHDLINLPVMNKSLYNTNICVQFGFNFFSKSADNSTDANCSYISSFLAPKYIAALCNVLAVIENKVVLNISNQYSNASNSINNTLVNNLIDLDNSKVVLDIIPAPSYQSEETEVKTCASQQKTNDQSETKPTVIIEDSFVETVDIQIKPTKTLNKDGKVSSPLSESTEDTTVLSKRDINLDPSETTQLPKVENTSSMEENKSNTQDQTEAAKHEDKTVSSQTTSSVIAQQDTVVNADSAESFEIGHDQLDKLLSELNLESDGHTPNAQTTAAPPNAPQQQQQKESVFLRLSNRIKALERNMSLSGQYLEELSRRYKKQVEDMQRAFEKKLTIITEENKKREERELRLQQKIDKLTNSVENLLTEKDSMWKTASLLGQFLLMEVFVTCILLYFCWKTPEGTTAFQRQRKRSGTVEVKRRKSIDTIGHESPVVHRKRRPSEEALKISGTYEDLLITDEAGMTKAEKRRRRKKNALHRSQSAVACKLPQVASNEEPTRRASSSDMNRKPTFLGSFQPNYVNGDLSPPAKIEEIPFVLEESEHTAVEPLDYFPIDVNRTDTISPDYIKTSLNKITKNGSIKSSILKSHSPIFKTALSSRNKRNSTSSKRLSLFKTDISQNSSQSRKSQSPDLSIQNSYSVSDSQDDQTSLNSDTSKKDKKLSGFKRIFKRVFE